MAFDLQNGYQPRTFAEILDAFTTAVNTQFSTSYDTETIVGTEYYKFFYAGAQLVMQAEGQTAEISVRMTDYIRTANERINLPKSTVDGFIDAIKDELGYDCTIKNLTIPAEAGHLFLIVDIPTPVLTPVKDSIIQRQHNYLTAGLYYEGAITGTKVAINGQVFDYAFDTPIAVNIDVRITAKISANAKTPILNIIQVAAIFDANFASLYKLGLDFEPEKYLEIARDLPFASDILTEYSEDAGATWKTIPRSMAYNQKIKIITRTVFIIT
jgi:hypothetical protein